ncbi:TetR/AcrR family transcriptional regulator [Prescottella agglutinans]|uniref:TetR/AcrR family transcriptional regulator n=1 Tax=Prescottella agglutinans TaxID=1644129 RepID=UPI003D954B52
MFNEEDRSRSRKPSVELVQVSAELLSRNGVRGFRLSDVAKGAGVSRGTVYNAFGDKEAAIDAGLAYLCSSFVERLAMVVPPGEPLRNQIGAAAAVIYEHATTPPALAPPLRTDTIIATLLDHYGDELCRAWAAFWAPLVTQARERGEVDSSLDATFVGHWIVRVLLSLELLPLEVAGFAGADDARGRVGDLLIDGFAPRRTP